MTHPLAEQLREQSQYGGVPADAELTMLKAADLIDALTGQEGAAQEPLFYCVHCGSETHDGHHRCEASRRQPPPQAEE